MSKFQLMVPWYIMVLTWIFSFLLGFSCYDSIPPGRLSVLFREGLVVFVEFGSCCRQVYMFIESGQIR